MIRPRVENHTEQGGVPWLSPSVKPIISIIAMGAELRL